MNSIVLLLVALVVLVLAYRYYGYFIATKVLMIDPSRNTPANTLNDGHDYVPTNKWVVFGHHFAAIAGAGPLIGPVLAAQFGYAPGFLWLLTAAVLAGGVHDIVILFASIRHRGMSLPVIAGEEVSRLTGNASSIAVLLIIIMTMAGLSIVIVNALFSNPWGTFTVAVTIPIALFIGLYMRTWRPGKIGEASVIGVILVLLGVVLGPTIQHSGLAHYFTFTDVQLKLLLPVYGFLAATLPVWLLLAPRDYLSSYMKIGTITLLALGIFLVRPNLHMPAVTPFVSGGGPIIPGQVWPFLMITIACGAISGFHALISSGTTPKMVESERDIPMVGYGAMLVECFVAIMALVAATVLQPGDYFAINTTAEAFAKIPSSLGFHITDLPQLQQLVGQEVAHRPGGAVSLAVGMAYIFSSIPGLKTLMAYWYQFAIMFEALFILTTIDAGTRVARYIAQDLLGRAYPPFKKVNWWPGVLFTSALVSLAWGYLLYGGSISTIWPIFGTANQLLATLALIIGTTIIFKINKKRHYALITMIPGFILFVTTMTAGFRLIYTNYLPNGMVVNAILVAIMLAIVLLVVIDSIVQWGKILRSAVE